MIRTRPRNRMRAMPLVALLVVFATSTFAHPNWHGDALVPLSNAAASKVAADLASGAVLPADLICEVDGPLTAVHHDPNPGVSGISGTVVVSGLPFLVPTSVPVQIGDSPGDETAFLNLTATPSGFPTFIGRGASIVGTFTLLPDTGSGAHVQCVADSFLVEAGHPPIIGIVTENGPGGLFVMGVRIIPYPDPRIAPFVRIQDLAAHPLLISELVPGSLVAVNGDYDDASSTIHAILIELDALIPSAPGEDDHLSILRVEARSARLEMRARGFTNNDAALVSIFDHSAGVKGVTLATGIPVDPLAGRWDARFDFAPVPTTLDGIPTRILAETNGGGQATAFVNIR